LAGDLGGTRGEPSGTENRHDGLIGRSIGRQSSILLTSFFRHLNIVPMVVPACVTRKSLWQQGRPAADHSVAEEHYHYIVSNPQQSLDSRDKILEGIAY
jgi:hypothetical protein